VRTGELGVSTYPTTTLEAVASAADANSPSPRENFMLELIVVSSSCFTFAPFIYGSILETRPIQFFQFSLNFVSNNFPQHIQALSATIFGPLPHQLLGMIYMLCSTAIFPWKNESFVKRPDTPHCAQGHLTVRPLMQFSCTEVTTDIQMICETCELLYVVSVLGIC
jgi:hypothetical protein